MYPVTNKPCGCKAIRALRSIYVIEQTAMSPTTLRLVNATSDQHVEAVMPEIHKLGPPTIPVVDCGNWDLKVARNFCLEGQMQI